MPRIIKIILLISTITFLVLAAVYALVDFPNHSMKGKLRRIDRFRPDFGYILKLSQGTQAPNKIQLTRYIQYYEFIQKLNLQDVALQELLAFCYFYQGQLEESQNQYLKILKNKPPSFWVYYNLAMVQLSQKDLDGALDAFHIALNLKPEETIKHLLSSKSYSQIIISNNVTPQDLLKSLEGGYSKASKYVEILQALASDPSPSPQKEEIIKNLIQQSHLILF